jgi:Putative beta-barrel porin-2, OmpL-like. bbp2
VSNLLRSLVAAAALVPVVALADAPPAAPAAPAAPAGPKVTFGGLVDSYASVNLDHTNSIADPIRAFDGTPGLKLAYAELNTTVDAGAAGLRLDLGFAPVAAGTTNLFVQQAYATYKFGTVAVDFGRFVTSAGAEVIEAKDNWLYSRSILFTWAIPFAHTGARVTIPVSSVDGLSLQLGVVNGWDDDATSTAGVSLLAPKLLPPAAFGPQKVGNLSLAYANEKVPVTFNLNVYAGQEQKNPDFRTLVDAVLGYTAGSLALNLNVDYAKQNGAAGGSWYGGALMARYSTDLLKYSVRGEYFDDKDGFRTGAKAKFYEGTLGAAYPVGTNAELRGEVRYDSASEAVFNGDKGFTTATLAALAWF